MFGNFCREPKPPSSGSRARAERDHGGAEQPSARSPPGAGAARLGRRSARADPAPRRDRPGPSSWKRWSTSRSTSARPGRPPLRDAREVGAAEDGLEVGREDHVERPARRLAEARHRLDEERVEIGALLAVDLDGDEARVEEAARCRRPRRSPSPSRGTSGRWRSPRRRRGGGAPAARARGPRGPTGTSRRGCARAARGRGSPGRRGGCRRGG